METTRPVVVKHVPKRVGLKEARTFFRDVQPLLTTDRPRLVFDLSEVKQLDASGVEMLLECMSEVMKHDGDLKLAALTSEAEIVMELTRTDRLFEIYRTAADAVRSFTRYMPFAMRHQPFGAAMNAPDTSAPTSPETAPSPGPPRPGGSSDVAA
jgi:anti-sigma B factor antagonist